MNVDQPYQPLLLRILHGLNGIFLILSILSAFWTYNTYDGRWGTVLLPNYQAIEGIHGTFGLYTLLIFPAFVLYACHQGQRRLIQPDSATCFLGVLFWCPVSDWAPLWSLWLLYDGYSRLISMLIISSGSGLKMSRLSGTSMMGLHWLVST